MTWLVDLIEAHPFASAAIAIGTFAGSILLTIAMLVRLPADYFVGETAPPWFAKRHPITRALLNTARNLAGLVLILLGVVMSFPGVPGQGVLTILLGLMLTDLPGKRRVERWLVARPMIRRAIDRIRLRRGKLPLNTE
ncbi:MAG TPA: hypothetical protein VL463_29485 [Kofleriaceae bacterium]|nr:hypothetical protein [Kofleriaceae bacterium]